jgi:hypothetical protein
MVGNEVKEAGRYNLNQRNDIFWSIQESTSNCRAFPEMTTSRFTDNTYCGVEL